MKIQEISTREIIGEHPADVAITYATGEQGMAVDTRDRTAPTHDEIAQLAFCLYESRGRHDRTATMSTIG